MTWTQVYDPMGNLALSAFMAAIPMIIIFYLLAIRRAPGQVAGAAAAISALLVAIIVYKMPVATALTATGMGALYGIFPIFWIVITAIFIYNMTVETGQFEIIKNSIATITDDRRLQALLIAFAFGAFLEGAAGFGTPVAISAGMLVGLGFNPLYAAGLCLIANTAPVAFGGIGIPIIVAGQVTGVDTMKNQCHGRTAAAVSVRNYSHLAYRPDVGLEIYYGSTPGLPGRRYFLCVPAMVFV